MKPKYLPSLVIACGLTLNFAMPDRANAIGFNFSTGAIADNTTTTFTTIATTAGTPISLILNLNHSDLTDLEIYLTSPSGKILNIAASLVGDASTTPITPTISDSGTFAIDTSSNPYNGTFQPSASIFTLALTPNITTFGGFGNESAGTYTLTIADLTLMNTGLLNSAILDVTPTAVPFEFDGSAGIAILGVAVAFRHWYKKRNNSKD